MKKKWKVAAIILLLSMLFLQGCSPKDLVTPVTTHSVLPNEDNRMCFDVSLKADLSKNYKWYTYGTMDMDESDSKFHEGLLNHTYNSDYMYTIRETGDFMFYLILVQDGNLETARIYPYKVTVKDDVGVSFQEMSAYNLDTDKKLKKTLENTLTIE